MRSKTSKLRRSARHANWEFNRDYALRGHQWPDAESERLSRKVSELDRRLANAERGRKG